MAVANVGFLHCSDGRYENIFEQGLSWNLKQRVPITSKSSNFKGETQRYVVKLPKSVGFKTPRVPGTHANSSPVNLIVCTKIIRGADNNWVPLFETKVVKKKIKIVNDICCSKEHSLITNLKMKQKKLLQKYIQICICKIPVSFHFSNHT